CAQFTIIEAARLKPSSAHDSRFARRQPRPGSIPQTFPSIRAGQHCPRRRLCPTNERSKVNMNDKAATHAITPDIAQAGRLTVYGLFGAQVSRNHHAIAVVEGDRRSTYGALNARVRRLASALHDRGIRRGNRIAVLSQNRTEYIEIELAAALIGAIVACQNWRLTAPELKGCLDLVGPSLIFVSERFAPLLASAGRRETTAITIE